MIDKGGDTINIKAAGAPNITGTFGVDSDSPSPTGAFYQDGRCNGANDWDSNNRFVRFDASRSSAAYGKSDTIQPAAISTFCQCRF